MRLKSKGLNYFLLIALVCLLISIQAAVAESKAPAVIIPFDTITAPGIEVWPQAKVVIKKYMLIESPLGGERIVFSEGTRYLGLALTGGDGIGAIRYSPLSVGIHRIKIMLAPDSAYTAPEQEMLISVWDNSGRILIISVDALRERLQDSIFPFLGKARRNRDRNPIAESVEVITDLSERYNLVYLYHGESSYMPEIKSWLAKHNYPVSPVVIWEDGKKFISKLIAERKREIEAVVVTSEDEANLFRNEQIRTLLLVENKTGFDLRRGIEDRLIVSDWEEIKQNID